MKQEFSAEQIKRANIIYHTKMADSYERVQPYYMPENIERVENIMKNLANKFGNNILLDIGCGTGFVLNIAKKYFNRVIGIDITEAMLDRVDFSSGNVEVRLAESAKIPFDNNSFNVCTAYSFLHHLPELTSTFKEVFRCLKIGGVFYADQDPNYYCWRDIKKLGRKKYSDILQNEANSINNISKVLTSHYDLDENTIKLAEFQKCIFGGMKEQQVVNSLKKVGFSMVNFEYQWFLGQGYVIHTYSKEYADQISKHLKTLLPLSKSLFKYFSFIAEK